MGELVYNADPSAMILFLSGYGIDAREVLVDGVDPDGYYQLVLTPEGYKVVDSDGALARRFVPWPERFDYGEFLRIFRGRNK